MRDQERANLALVLHGSWSDGVFFVWGESAEPAPKPRGRQPRVRPHPHAAPPDRLREALETLAPLGAWADAPTTTRVILLPSSADRPRLPPWLVSEVDTGATDTEAEFEPRLTPWKVTGLALDIVTDLDLLVTLPLGEAGERWWGTDLRYWGLVAKLGLEFLAHHKYLPGLTENEGQYRAAWLPVMDDPHDRARLHALAQAMPPVCRAIFAESSTPKPDQALAPHALLDNFIKRLVDQAVRDWGRVRLDRRRKPPQGIAGAWWAALWDADDGQIEVELAQRRELAGLFDAWQGWMRQLRGAEHQEPARQADTGYSQSTGRQPRRTDGHAGREPAVRTVVHHAVSQPRLFGVADRVSPGVRVAHQALSRQSRHRAAERTGRAIHPAPPQNRFHHHPGPAGQTGDEGLLQPDRRIDHAVRGGGQRITGAGRLGR